MTRRGMDTRRGAESPHHAAVTPRRSRRRGILDVTQGAAACQRRWSCLTQVGTCSLKCYSVRGPLPWLPWHECGASMSEETCLEPTVYAAGRQVSLQLCYIYRNRLAYCRVTLLLGLCSHAVRPQLVSSSNSLIVQFLLCQPSLILRFCV